MGPSNSSYLSDMVYFPLPWLWEKEYPNLWYQTHVPHGNYMYHTVLLWILFTYWTSSFLKKIYIRIPSIWRCDELLFLSNKVSGGLWSMKHAEPPRSPQTSFSSMCLFDAWKKSSKHIVKSGKKSPTKQHHRKVSHPFFVLLDKWHPLFLVP